MQKCGIFFGTALSMSLVLTACGDKRDKWDERLSALEATVDTMQPAVDDLSTRQAELASKIDGMTGPHAASHEAGGTDPIDVTGLGGVLATAQTPAAHSHDDLYITPTALTADVPSTQAYQLTLADDNDNDGLCVATPGGGLNAPTEPGTTFSVAFPEGFIPQNVHISGYKEGASQLVENWLSFTWKLDAVQSLIHVRVYNDTKTVAITDLNNVDATAFDAGSTYTINISFFK